MAGRNVTPPVSHAHTVLCCMMREYQHIISIQNKKPIGDVKQWSETSRSSPGTAINVDEDQSTTNLHFYKQD